MQRSNRFVAMKSLNGIMVIEIAGMFSSSNGITS